MMSPQNSALPLRPTNLNVDVDVFARVMKIDYLIIQYATIQ